MQQCLCEARRLCPGLFDVTNPHTPCTAGNAAHQQQHRSAGLSEYITRVSDVLCLSAVTTRGLVHGWFEAEGLDVRPSKW